MNMKTINRVNKITKIDLHILPTSKADNVFLDIKPNHTKSRLNNVLIMAEN